MAETSLSPFAENLFGFSAQTFESIFQTVEIEFPPSFPLIRLKSGAD
jgi:hypothetical protein